MSKHRAYEEPASAPDLLDHYSAGTGIFDELNESPSAARPHWRPLIQSLQELGRHELQSRWESGRRIIREHGVTYNVYGDPEGMDRPWGLDLVPLLISPEEWARVEAGLIQRTRLFNLILADIYGGSQRLLRDGFLPPELVYANPAFLRPCRGMQITGKVYVQLHACDLGRSPDGQWWVLSDRTQSPSGAGYAWQNRSVLSRILPEQIRDCHVQRLAGFFQRLREMLFHLASSGRNQPSIVLLTPGPHNETYFEHAYLARSLGFPLVEGADLTVRERRLFLKTIEGLQPVDVILRRVDDSFCDPLELRGESLLGVSGLLEAARAGNVTVANALGSGLLESPAFLAFLPGVCRHLLDEELLLPSIATWWCGQGKELRYVTDHLSSLVLRPAFAGQPPLAPSINAGAGGRQKMAQHRRELLQMIQANPRAFVAQERVKLSRAPAWIDGQLSARPVVLRAYVANGGDSFAVLPGGLTRVLKNSNDFWAINQTANESKDTWVLSNGSANVSEPAHFAPEVRGSSPLAAGVPSRAADHLFWLGRYTERLEQLLRLVRCVLGALSSEAGFENSPERAALAQLTVQLGLARDGQLVNGDLPDRMLQLLYAPEETGSVRDLLKRIRLSASAVRDRFSGDTWRILGRLDADARARPGRLPIASATALAHNLVLDLAAFNGMEMENMTRGRGWRFLDFGRRLERGLSVLNLLRAAVTVDAPPPSLLEAVLEIADSVMTYKRQYFAAPHLAGVLALLLRDESNPRSLAFQLSVVLEHVHALDVDAHAVSTETERNLIDTLAEAIHTANFEDRPSGTLEPILQLLKAWIATLFALSDEITNRYFSHSTPRIS